MNVHKMTDLDLAGKRVLIREDLNVPVKQGRVTSDARIRACLPTIQAALEACQYNKTKAAKHLGITFRALRYRIAKLGMN